MAGKWEGFTDEDIGHYLNNNDETKETEVPKKSANFIRGRGKKNVARERMQAGRKASSSSADERAIPDAARLSRDVQESVPLVVEDKDDKVKDEPTVQPLAPATLEVFEARQKMLEEQNRRRKELLTQVLSDRKKQTTEEAKRLQGIQDELHKMDVLLSCDVGILRDQIEVASLEFADAQKRYNRAEREFAEAKQNLFGKLERKELLTKHLCTIIEESEMRKAQKLSELMDKLTGGDAAAVEDTTIKSVIKSPYFESAVTDQKQNKKTQATVGLENKGFDSKGSGVQEGS